MAEQPTTPPQIPGLACAVLAVSMRVAGPVITDVQPHALGLPERQVSVRIGDALVYLTDRRVTARIRQQWDAAQYLAAKRLPEHAPQRWLAPSAPTYPVGICVHLTGPVKVTTRYLPAHHATRTPPHLRDPRRPPRLADLRPPGLARHR